MTERSVSTINIRTTKEEIDSLKMRINRTSNNVPVKTTEENSFDFEKDFKEGENEKKICRTLQI